jgi:hypothetical protein
VIVVGTAIGVAHSSGDTGVIKLETVSTTAAAPELTTAGTEGAVAINVPRNGKFAIGANTPAARVTRPTETLSMARTTSGSNCVPAFFVSSWRASSIGRGFLYARAAVMTAKASATATIRALSEMSAPASPLGYPFPSQRS